ncbi:hypothetical protein BD410DRAFT_531558 [Rickenella mellea]|uniref:Uncharacterized protein n=1 Tax=Rickenella mellea TaxID=50990 RepID=A0A4Y7QH71_9AGAM|nr:hypothetical protein BD410DRAFT_531558 [Rickenella mellea]
MSSWNQTEKLGSSTEDTGVTFADMHSSYGMTDMKPDPTDLEFSYSSDACPPGGPDGVAHRYHDENAIHSMPVPELTTPDVMNPAYDGGIRPFPIKDGLPRYTQDSSSRSHGFPSFPTDELSENSPFHDNSLLERLRLARYGANIVNGEVLVDFARIVEFYIGNNYQRCQNFVTQMDAVCRFLEARLSISDILITDVVGVLRGTPGWPNDSGDDEVTQAWTFLYILIDLPDEIVSMTVSESSANIEEQIRTLFPPTPPQATPLNFQTTLSDILRAGLKVKPAMVMDTSPYNAAFYRSNLHNRAARALHVDGWMKEIIASTFALLGKKVYDQTAEELKLFVHPTKPEEWTTMRKVFWEFGNTPPKLLAHRAIELENLVRSRRAFWPTLRRDLRRQRKEQPFAFWGAILALFFGICTVIQTVTSVWTLVAVHGNSPQASQTMPGNVVNGMRILGSPWLNCMTSDKPMAATATKENATISCILQIGVR